MATALVSSIFRRALRSPVLHGSSMAVPDLPKLLSLEDSAELPR